jgi:DNA-binding transcriptional ArsR family regulator
MSRQESYEIQAELGRAIGNPLRMEIMDLLRDGQLSVRDIASATSHPVTAISQSLAVLRSAGIVIARRDGNNILYHIANPKITSVCDLLREVLCEQIGERAKIMDSVYE